MRNAYGAVTALAHRRGAVYHDYTTLVFKHLGDGLPGQLVSRGNLSDGPIRFVCGFAHIKGAGIGGKRGSKRRYPA